tara:strand:+ start:26 stop:292 length:267 start_codon:yes stop_codon:yes gene_type:complete
MGSLGRKMARNKAKKQKKEMKQLLGLFDKLGDECAACEAPYDKTSKEQAMTWKVVVREQEQVVRLYCPDCWNKTTEAIKQVEEAMNNE